MCRNRARHETTIPRSHHFPFLLGRIGSVTAKPPFWIFDSASESDTEALGKRLAAALEPGTVVALVGNLGAGKTRLVRSVAAAAGVDSRQVTSPTFVLVQEYEGEWPIYHFDTYRLASSGAFEDLGVDEYFAGAGVCFVEWADRVADVLPADHLRIEIETTAETGRRFRLTATGAQGERVLARMGQF